MSVALGAHGGLDSLCMPRGEQTFINHIFKVLSKIHAKIEECTISVQRGVVCFARGLFGTIGSLAD